MYSSFQVTSGWLSLCHKGPFSSPASCHVCPLSDLRSNVSLKLLLPFPVYQFNSLQGKPGFILAFLPLEPKESQQIHFGSSASRHCPGLAPWLPSGLCPNVQWPPRGHPTEPNHSCPTLPVPSPAVISIHLPSPFALVWVLEGLPPRNLLKPSPPPTPSVATTQLELAPNSPSPAAFLIWPLPHHCSPISEFPLQILPGSCSPCASHSLPLLCS